MCCFPLLDQRRHPPAGLVLRPPRRVSISTFRCPRTNRVPESSTENLRASSHTLPSIPPCMFVINLRPCPNVLRRYKSILSPCQKKVLVTNGSQELTVYDLESAHVLFSVRNAQLLAASPITYVHDGNAILVGCNDGRARLYDSDLSSCLQMLNHDGW